MSNQTTAKFISDQPISKNGKKDSLGFKKYANILANFARNTPGPFTIGIHAEWGYGKTSLLEKIKENLDTIEESTPIIIPIWFNAWQFEQEDHPLIPLILTIITMLEKHQKWQKVTQKHGQNLLKALTGIAAGLLASIKLKAGVQIPTLTNSEIELSPETFVQELKNLDLNNPAAAVEDLKTKSVYYIAFDELTKACEALKDETKIVLLIDDLDRCSPEKTHKLLESIKLVLNQPNFIFFLALDNKVVETYLDKKYKEELGTQTAVGEFYLNKLIQVPFYVPSHEQTYESFIKDLLKQFSKEDDKEFNEIITLLGKHLFYNPRSTIRILNTTILYDQLYHAIEEHPEKNMIRFFAVTIILRTRYPGFYEHIKKYDQKILTIAADWESTQIETADTPAKHETFSKQLEKIWELLKKDEQGMLKQLLLDTDAGKDWLRKKNLRDIACDLATQQNLQTNQTERDYWSLITDGNVYLSNKKYDLAINNYNKAIELNPSEATAYYNRGLVQQETKQYDLAMKDYNKAIELNPNFAIAYNNRGSIWNEKKEYDLAIQDFNKTIELNPNYINAYYNRGNTWNGKKEYDLAIQDYNKTIELNPNDSDAYNNRGRTRYYKKEYDLAIQDYNKAIEINPNFAIAYNNRGATWQEKKDIPKARTDYEKALKVDPNYQIAKSNLKKLNN